MAALEVTLYANTANMPLTVIKMISGRHDSKSRTWSRLIYLHSTGWILTLIFWSCSTTFAFGNESTFTITTHKLTKLGPNKYFAYNSITYFYQAQTQTHACVVRVLVYYRIKLPWPTELCEYRCISSVFQMLLIPITMQLKSHQQYSCFVWIGKW